MGAAYCSKIENCTIVNNNGYGVVCGAGDVINSIVYYNFSDNNYTNTGTNVVYENCCTIPFISGDGNISNLPGFVSVSNLHLKSNSPCIDSGRNLSWMDSIPDLDGNPRIIGYSVDIGAYEYTPAFWCSLTADKTEVIPDDIIQFSSETSEDSPASVYYCWDFDNGGSWDIQGLGTNSPSWSYAEEGTYSVLLTVSNTVGQTATTLRSDYISVVPEPVLFIIYCLPFIIYYRSVSFS